MIISIIVAVIAAIVFGFGAVVVFATLAERRRQIDRQIALRTRKE